MSASPDPRDELSRLLSALEDDLLEPGDAARLGELLRTDPEARRRYYDYVILASLLRREGRRAAASQEPDSEAAKSPIAPPREISIRRDAPRWRAWLLALAGSALLALLLSVGEVTGVTRLVPTIVRIFTGEGSLVIEVDDPTVSVTLDGEDITIHGAGIHELKLRPGTHRFVATKDGRPARAELVTIQKGERTVVAVSFEPAAAATPAESESRVLLGHTGPVWSVAITGDGNRAVSASLDGTVRVWETATGNEVARFEGHNSCVYSAVILPDGKRVLSGSAARDPNAPGDWSVCLWDLETGHELNRWEGEGDGISSIVSASGDLAVIGAYSGRVTFWNVTDWREIRSIQTAPRIWSVHLSPDEQRLLTASGHLATPSGELNGGVRLWDATTGSELIRLAGHQEGAWQAVFSPSGEQIASTGTDRTIRVWNALSGEPLHVVDVDNVTTSLAYSHDGHYLLTGSYGASDTVRLWDVETKVEVKSFHGHTSGVQSVALSRDGRWAVSGSHDCTVRLWKLPFNLTRAVSPAKGAPAAASESRRFLGHTDDVGCAVFTPDGRQALSSGYDACVRVWDVETGRELRRFTGHKGPVWSVAVSPDGRRALSSSGGALERPAEERECSVCLWEVESGKELRRTEAQSWAFISVAFSPDGSRALFGCYDGTVRLWDIEQWKEIRRFNHMRGLWSVRFSPDGRLALTFGGWEGALARLWDLESGQELRQFDVPSGGFQAVFSPDGRSLLCAAAEGAVRLWDVETGKLIRLFPHKGGVAAVEFSPDGRFVVCGGYEGTVRVWHVETGEERLRMEGHKQRIRTVAYSPDGRYVLSGSRDRTARLWQLPTEVYQNAAVGVAEHPRKEETATPENGVRAVP
jgi:WD40 repeat protein